MMAGAPSAGRVAIIAGGGAFPLEIAEAAARAGHDVRIVGLRGFGARALRRFPVLWSDMLDPGKVLDSLRAIAPEFVVLAGHVTRPGPLAIGSVFAAFRNRDDLGRILAGGDDRLLRGVVALIEEAGFRVVGAQDVAPDLLAADGAMTGRAPDDRSWADIALGVDLLTATGRFDVGQACVVSCGRILAVEGPEGTDAMLKRVARL